MRKKRIAIILIGLSLSWILCLTGIFQIDTMFFDAISYEDAAKWIWIPELGLNLVQSFQIMFLLVVLGQLTPILTWLAASRIKKEASS